MGSQYQSFPDARGASQTTAKLQSLMLPAMRGKAFLDVGCNEGFFCAIALGAGASRVVGIDTKAEVLERARRRFGGIEFRNQSWDDPIEGRFDTVLCASAIHYARDQPALIDKLAGLLTPDGVLVLELGIAQQGGDQYVNVQRPAGGSCDFATPDTLRRVLAAYDVREIGASIGQRGDPVPRFVLHIRHRRKKHAHEKAAPAMVLFDALSRSAKSTTVRLLQQRAPEDATRALAIDGLLIRIAQHDFHPEPAYAAVHQAIERFRREKSPRTDLILPMLHEQGLFEDFLALVESMSGAGSVPVTLWDGFLPSATREQARLWFERRGYRVWNSFPRQRFNVARLDVSSLGKEKESGPDAGTTRAAPAPALARLKSLQLPRLQDKTLLALGPEAQTVCELAARAGATVSGEQDSATAARFDVIVLLADTADTAAAVARARELLARLEPNGLLAIEFPATSGAMGALARLGGIARHSERSRGSDPASLLRRELPECVVRKVTTGLLASRAARAQVVHIEPARPLLVLVEDVAASAAPSLLETIGAARNAGVTPRLSVAELVTCLERQTPLPRAPLVVCAGALPAERRESLLEALVGSGYVAWELRERAAFAFEPLDIEQALQVVFPGATLETLAQAEQRSKQAKAGTTVWQRVRKLARVALRRVRPRAASAAPSAPAPPESAPRRAESEPSRELVEGLLHGVRVTEDGIELRGWAVDLATRRAVPDFVVELDGAAVTDFRLSRVLRPAISARFDMPPRGRPGFKLLIAAPGTVSVPRDRVRVGCRLRNSGEVHWLRTAPDQGLSPAPGSASGASD